MSSCHPPWAPAGGMGGAFPRWRSCRVKGKGFFGFLGFFFFTRTVVERWSGEIAEDYSPSDSVPLCGSELVVCSAGVFQVEIRNPHSSSPSTTTSSSSSSDGTSVSLQSNLNQPCRLPGNSPGDGENRCWPASTRTFEVFPFDLLSLPINLEICFRDLMSPRQHPVISPRRTRLEVPPVWSCWIHKSLQKLC